MNKVKKVFAATFILALGMPLLATSPAFARSSILTSFNNLYGTSATKLNTCDTCHTSGYGFNPYGNAVLTQYSANGGNATAAFQAVEQLDSDGDGVINIDEIKALTFPGDPSDTPVIGPACTDSDGDGYALEGGACGPIDCNDNDPAVNPGAVENCTDGIDNNCNGQVDAADPTATGCPATNPNAQHLGIFRGGKWYLDSNGNGTWEMGTDTQYPSFGMPGDIPVSGAWTGGGTLQIGVYRNGAWYLDSNGNGTWDAGVDTKYPLFGGALNDAPVAGDWNGDGVTRIGIFRDGKWYLDTNGNGAWDAGVDTLYASFGMAGDQPVAGDWKGTGKSEIGVFRNGTWYLDTNGNGTWDAGVDTLYANFGLPGDIPVVGDWNGDGKTEIGVYRNGKWYLDTNGNGQWDGGGTDEVHTSFGGGQTDIPVAVQ